MAKYDRLKKCKCNGCPLFVDVVTDKRLGNGVCEFHDAALAKDWMLVRDRIVEHGDFLQFAQRFYLLSARYKPLSHELINAYLARIKKDLRFYILSIERNNFNHSMSEIKHLLEAKHA